MIRPLDSILIKPAGPDCNMACDYCFYLEKSKVFPQDNVHRMSEETLEEMILQMMQQTARQISFGWQGGEPTLMGLQFFRRAVELQQKHGRGQAVSNSLQTNGLLIDQEWCSFLRDYRFLVGLSLDGPEHVHDHYRKTTTGGGSYTRAKQSCDMMLENQVEVNVLSVLNDHSVHHVEEIYQHHKDLGFQFMQFIPCLETDAGKILPFSLQPEAYGKALCQLFDLWIDDFQDGVPSTSIRYFDSLFFHYVDMAPPDCTMREQCGVYLVVEHNGDLFPCDFYVEEALKLGNLHESNMVEVFNSEVQLDFGRTKEQLSEECLECSWLKFCRGGCPKERLAGGLNYYCQAFKEFFEYSQQRFQQMAIKWKSENNISEAAQGKTEKVGRNSPCPCGSGIKYKKCCGK